MNDDDDDDDDKHKTKKQLIDELAQLRHRLNDLETRDQDDTVRRQMEEMLRASVEQWYTTFNMMSDAICLIDSQGRIQRCNRAMTELLDKPLSAILGHHCWKVVHGTSEPIDECPVVRMQESLSRESLVVLLGDRWFAVSVDPLPADDGQSMGAVHVMTDITERKRGEEAVLASRRELKRTLEATTDGIWTWNFASGQLTFSPRYYEMLGYAPDEFPATYENWVALIHPDDRASALAVATEYLKEKPDEYENEFRLRTKGGDYRWIHIRARVVERDEHGQAVYMIGNHEDITERKRAEEQIRFQATLLDAVGQAVIATDLDGTIVYLNRAAEKLYDWSAAEALGRDVTDVTVPEISQDEAAQIMERLSVGESWSGEFLVRRRDGTAFPVLLYDTPVLDATGKLIGIVGVSSDITERKRAEEALAEQAEQLRLLSARLADAQETERRRIARELHDQVGQNLTALGINLNVLRPHLTQAPQAAQACLDDLLAQVKGTTGRIRGVIADLRPPELDDYGLLAALHWYAGQVRVRTGLDVSVEGEPIAPRLSSQQETAFFRIAQEALTNVVKHAQATWAKVTVEIEEEAVRMTIVDDGVGFDSASLEEAGATPHWGLLTMRERAQAVGAHWCIETSPGEDTRVVVEMARPRGGE